MARPFLFRLPSTESVSRPKLCTTKNNSPKPSWSRSGNGRPIVSNRLAPIFGECGGCAYQHIDYEHQLAIKQQQVRDILQRIGKIKDVPIRSIVLSPAIYGYRNRITVHARDGTVGFFRRDSHRLIDIERCPIANDEVNRELADLRALKPVEGHYTLRARLMPRVFSQTNDAVAIALRDLVVDLVSPGQKLLVDGYCGAGFFAKALLDKFDRVIGIDWDKFSIAEAKKGATAKETYIAGDVEEELAKVGAVHLNRLRPGDEDTHDRRLGSIAPTLIVDPPAAGLSTDVRKTILELAPARLIYVSCNPATLARDLNQLRHRFKIESITPLDMFPQTAEIEIVASASSR